MSYQIMIAVFLTIIDVFLENRAAASFMPLFIAICPSLFIYPIYVMIVYMISFDTLFIILSTLVKSADFASNDTFNGLVGLAFGLCILAVVTNLRSKEYRVRTGYRDLSQIDGLTGIYNKTTCEYLISDYLSKREMSSDCALIILDIDDFKHINDSYGHKMGDEIIANVAQILSDIFKDNGIIGRFGGDEFIIMIKEADSDAAIRRQCMQILNQVSGIHPNGDRYSLSCSMGIARTNGQYISYEDMFKYADDALYEAKNFGKSQFILYTNTTPDISDDKYMLIIDDQTVDRMVLRETFKDSYKIIECSNGREALEILSQNSKHISIVLLDIYMDDIDGYDVLQFMKSRTHTQRIPVVVITAESHTEEYVLEKGADDMIPKPIDPAIARLRVSKAIKRSITSIN